MPRKKTHKPISSHDELGKALLTNPVTGQLAWTKYIKNKPSAKQLAFCMLPHREALYGGAAGGGKSDALLMAALQFVNVPKYNAIIFRKSLADLERSEGLLDRAWDWLGPWIQAGEAAYDASTHRFLFAEGGSLTFGFIGSATAWEHYQGGAYQFIGWDELTQHSERYYNEMKGRLRRGLCNAHEGRTVNGHLDPLPFDEDCPTCNDYALVSRVPLRIRATSNPGGQGACVPFGEVMTPNGWRDIKDFQVGDPVFTVDAGGYLQTSQVSQVHQSFYSGNLLEVEQRGFYLLATPNHKVAKLGGVVGDRNKNFSLVELSQLPGQAYIKRAVSWCGSNPKRFYVPAVKTRKLRLSQPLDLSWEDYATLMGWYLSEGSCVGRDRAFQISQKKMVGRNSLKRFMRLSGFVHHWDKNGVIVYSPAWYEYLKQFGKAKHKHIPTELKNSTRGALRCLLGSLMAGDGHWATKNKAGVYFSISKRLADDVCEVALKLGYMVRLRHRGPRRPSVLDGREIPNAGVYEVQIKKQKVGASEVLTGNSVYNLPNSTTRKPTLKPVPFNGPVYCIGVDNTHSFIIRQRGSVWVSGNSWVKKHFKLQRTKSTAYISETRGITEEQAALYVKNGGTGWQGIDPAKPYIPAFYTDNPGLDHEAYKTSLGDITDEERFAELAKGDWEFTNNGRFKRQWFQRRYRFIGGYVRLLDAEGKDQYSFHINQLRKYVVADVAASQREGVGGQSFMVTTTGAQTVEASFTNIGVFGITPKFDLLVLEQQSFQEEVPEIFERLKAACRTWRPMHVGIDAKGLGKGVAQMALQMGIPVMEILCHTDKISNSGEAQIRCKQGKIVLPEEGSTLWDEEWLDLITSWRGFKGERDDEVDVLSNACHHFTMVGGNMDLDYSMILHANDNPIVSSFDRYCIDFDFNSAPDAW